MNKSYYDEDLGISLEMPFTWNAAQNEQLPLILMAPMERGFRANMSFLVKPIDPPTPEALQLVIESARADREASYQDFELVSEERIMQDNYPGHIEHYHWTMDEKNKPLTQMFALILTGPEAMYSIHATCLRKLEDKYLPKFRDVIESLRFTKSD